MDAETRAYLDDMKAEIDKRFDAVDQQIGQVIELIRALATGTAARFDAIERKVDRQPSLKLVP